MEVLMDYISNLNWVAVMVAAVAAFIVSAVWYSQGVFGKVWMKAAGIKKSDIKNVNTPVTMAISFVTVVVTAAALAVLFDVLQLEGVLSGALLGILVALGFVLMNKAMHSLSENKSSNYLIITGIGDTVSLAVIGGVLGLFS